MSISKKRNILIVPSKILRNYSIELNPSFWIGLQNDYDLGVEENKLKREIKSMNFFKKITNKSI
jgi:plasmid maintenance system antidote protein VapI